MIKANGRVHKNPQTGRWSCQILEKGGHWGYHCSVGFKRMKDAIAYGNRVIRMMNCKLKEPWEKI